MLRKIGNDLEDPARFRGRPYAAYGWRLLSSFRDGGLMAVKVESLTTSTASSAEVGLVILFDHCQQLN